MKNKNEKIAIGIFLDGLNLKIAQVAQTEKHHFQVLKLREFKLPDHFISGPSNDNAFSSNLNSPINLSSPENNSISFNEPKDNDINLDSMEDFMGINDDGLLADSTSSHIEEEEDLVSHEDIPLPKEGQLVAQTEIAKFLSDFTFDQSKVSFTASEDKIFWTYLPYSNKKKSKSQYRKQLLSKEQTKDPTVQFDLLTNSDGSGYALIYQGQHEVINILESAKSVLNLKHFNYHHADPIEISLINALFAQYRFPEKQYVLLLYLSKEIKIAVITFDNNFVKSFPLIIQGSDYDIIREAIVSKIMLEQDISQLNITQNVLLAGEFTSEVDLDFFALHFKSDYIDVFSFDNPFIPPKGINISINEFVKEKNISSYLIPIALAIKSLDHKNKHFIHTNLLPPDILEKQKIFKLAWHGYVILGIIFASTLWTTSVVLSSNKKLNELEKENQQIEYEINQKKAFQNVLQTFNSQLAMFEDTRKKVTDVVKTNNQWNFIIQKITSFAENNGFFWLRSIQAGDENFTVIGLSSSRGTISAFSNLLPQGSINRINLIRIESEQVWEFEVNFHYPDPTLYDPLFSEIKVDTLAIRLAIEKNHRIEQTIINEQVSSEAQSKTNIPETKPEVKKEIKKETVKEQVPPKVDKTKKEQKPARDLSTDQNKKTAVEKPLTPITVKKETKKTEIKNDKAKEEQKVSAPQTKPVQHENTVYDGKTYTKARKLYLEGKYKESLDLFEKFTSGNPDHKLIPLSWYLMGESYFGLHDYQKALIYFEKASQYPNKKAESLLMAGNCYKLLNQNEKAIQTWEQLMNECSSSPLTKTAEKKLQRVKGSVE